jgi:hypothetical protein
MVGDGPDAEALGEQVEDPAVVAAQILRTARGLSPLNPKEPSPEKNPPR